RQKHRDCLRSARNVGNRDACLRGNSRPKSQGAGGSDPVLQASAKGGAAIGGNVYGQNGLKKSNLAPRGSRESQRSKHMAYPANYRYTNQHEWVDAKGEVATIGITD